jgi:hypothetical protein
MGELTDLLQQNVSARGTVRITLLRRPQFPTTSKNVFEFTIDLVGWHKVNRATKIGTLYLVVCKSMSDSKLDGKASRGGTEAAVLVTKARDETYVSK